MSEPTFAEKAESIAEIKEIRDGKPAKHSALTSSRDTHDFVIDLARKSSGKADAGIEALEIRKDGELDAEEVNAAIAKADANQGVVDSTKPVLPETIKSILNQRKEQLLNELCKNCDKETRGHLLKLLENECAFGPGYTKDKKLNDTVAAKVKQLINIAMYEKGILSTNGFSETALDQELDPENLKSLQKSLNCKKQDAVCGCETFHALISEFDKEFVTDKEVAEAYAKSWVSKSSVKEEEKKRVEGAKVQNFSLDSSNPWATEKLEKILTAASKAGIGEISAGVSIDDPKYGEYINGVLKFLAEWQKKYMQGTPSMEHCKSVSDREAVVVFSEFLNRNKDKIPGGEVTAKKVDLAKNIEFWVLNSSSMAAMNEARQVEATLSKNHITKGSVAPSPAADKLGAVSMRTGRWQSPPGNSSEIKMPTYNFYPDGAQRNIGKERK